MHVHALLFFGVAVQTGHCETAGVGARIISGMSEWEEGGEREGGDA